MRNLLLIAVFLFSMSAQLFANNGLSKETLYVSENEKTVVLNLACLVDKVEFLSITDANGDVIFEDKIETNKKFIKYNLWQLPSDNYTIKVTGGKFVEYYHALITNDLVSLVSSETYFRPVVRNLNEKVLVNASLKNEEDIQVTILDRTGEVVYVFSENKLGNYKRVFNLEQLKSGTYSVIISTDHFSEEIKISL